MSKRNVRRMILGAVGLVLAIIAVAIWWFLRDDAPDEVSLDAAIETLEDSSTTSTNLATTSGATSLDGMAGVWSIDTESGEFDYETATGSFVGFRIEEELRSVGSTTAVGRTGDIEGSMTIEGTTVVAAEFTIDTTTITTNSSKRDDNVQDALETDSFPTASFVLTEPIELGSDAAGGGAVGVTATGDMTIHGVTLPIELAMEARLVDDVVVVVGSTTMTFSDYDVTVPQGGPVISVDDFGVVELQFLLRR